MKKNTSSDTLWAPWRITYITGAKEKGCLFCRASRSTNDEKYLVVDRQKHSFAILNLYPYNNGHVMVAPHRHVSDIAKLSTVERNALFAHVVRVQKALKAMLKPEGFNVGMNIGDVAGAGIKDHVHVHVVPRWKGDTNFMPAIGATNVISQSLEELYAILTKKLAKQK